MKNQQENQTKTGRQIILKNKPKMSRFSLKHPNMPLAVN